MNRVRAQFWDFPAVLLPVLILLTVSQRLNATHWTDGLGSTVILSLVGFVLGMVFGFSQFKRGAVFWLSLGYSVPIVILVLDRVLDHWTSWTERAADLSNRLFYSLALFTTGRPVKDTVLFIVFIALVFWIIGLISGFAISRFKNFTGAVLPAGIVMVIIQLYDPANKINNFFLASFMLLSLLLLGRLAFNERRLFWIEQRVAQFSESRTELNITLIMVAIIIVMLAWLTPTSTKFITDAKTAWDEFTHPVRSVQENLGNAVAGLQGGSKIQTADFYGDVLALGRQAATGETAYFRIQAPSSDSTLRYYWQVRAYNVFQNDQWYAMHTSSTPFLVNQAPLSAVDREGVTGFFAFTSLAANLAVLVTPSHPVWVSVPAEVIFLQGPQGQIDPLEFQSISPVMAGQQYIVHANVFEPTILQLRNVGNSYPDWVTSNYLQLPDNLSPKIVALAREITKNATTTYDRVNAITDYLRNTITYTTTVENPPAGQDPLEWFLFDSKKGFCNYYATAEVILLRSLGIPTRMVVGFAQGKFDGQYTYTVRQADSHAWPEVYFSEVGWVEFEPTTNQSPLVRPQGSVLSAGQVPTEIPPETELQKNIRRGTPAAGETAPLTPAETLAVWLIRLIYIFIIILSILRITAPKLFDNGVASPKIFQMPVPVLVNNYFVKRGWTAPGWLVRWAFLAEKDPFERSFETVFRSMHWLGETPHPAQTPAEAAAYLAERLPDVSKEIHLLLNEYQLHLYSRKSGHLPRARLSARDIRNEALRASIVQRLRAFRGIFKH